MTAPLRVVIADDHPVFRSGLQALLGVEPGIEVVGEAQTGSRRSGLANELQPDVVLMDLHMPDLDGVAATKQIMQTGRMWRCSCSRCSTTMIGVRGDASGRARLPVQGHEPGGDVVRSVHLVGAGGAMFGPAVAQRVLEFFARPRTDSVPRSRSLN